MSPNNHRLPDRSAVLYAGLVVNSSDRGVMKKLITAGLAAGLTVASFAIANVAQAQSTYYANEAKRQLTVTGLTPGAEATIGWYVAPFKTFTPKACGAGGLVKVPYVVTTDFFGVDFIEVGETYSGTTTSINTAQVATITTVPSCVNGSLPTLPAIPGGSLTGGKIGTDYYIAVPAGQLAFAKLAEVQQKKVVNACGMARFTYPAPTTKGLDTQFSGLDLPSISVGDLALDGATQVTAPPICRKNTAGGGVLYVKAPTN